MQKDIYIFSDGELKREQNTLVFYSQEGKKFLPVEQVEHIWIFGEVDINKRLLEFMTQKEITLHFFNYHDYYIGSFYPREHLNSGYVILKQAEHYLDYSQRLYLAIKIVQAAVANILVVLKYYNSRDVDLREGIFRIEGLYEQLSKSTSIEQLMALEGNVRESYYHCFTGIIKNEDFKFVKRSKRPPLDSLNALISFGNSVMYSKILGEIYNTQLDPRIGYLHSTNSRRFSLNLDIAEIFKPILVDRTIFTLLNRKIITKRDFESRLNGVYLTERGRKKFIEEFSQKLQAVIKHPHLNTNVSYRRLIRLELYKLQKHITEGEVFEGFVARW